MSELRVGGLALFPQSGPYMTPGEFPLSLSVSDLRFPSLFKLGFGFFFSDQRKEVLLAPP